MDIENECTKFPTRALVQIKGKSQGRVRFTISWNRLEKILKASGEVQMFDHETIVDVIVTDDSISIGLEAINDVE